jgi:hypothetical protein
MQDVLAIVVVENYCLRARRLGGRVEREGYLPRRAEQSNTWMRSVLSKV